MKNLLTSLKKLGKKMTGSDVTGTDLVTVVDNIADGYSGGGGSGGGGQVIITADNPYFMSPTLDKSYDEIREIVESGDRSLVIEAHPAGPSLCIFRLDSYSDNALIFRNDGISGHLDVSSSGVTWVDGV